MINCTLTWKKVLLPGLIFLLSACQASSTASSQPPAAPGATRVPVTNARLQVPPDAALTSTLPPDTLDVAASLASVKQIGNLPFYTMTLVGDYDFSLLPDSQPAQSYRVPPSLPWGCTVFTAQTPSGDRLLARNFDWYDHPALLLFTDPSDGYASAAMVDIS